MKNQTGIVVKHTKLTAKKVKANFKEIFKVLSKTTVMAIIGKPSAFKELAGLISEFKFAPDASDLSYQLLLSALINASHTLAEENIYNFKTNLQDAEKLYDKKEYVQFLEGIDKVIEGDKMELEYEMLKNPRLIPLLKPFKEYFNAYLRLFGIAESEAKCIANRLPTYFVFELNNEWRKNFTKYEPLYQQFNTPISEAAKKEREWEAYYAYLEREVAMPVFGESFGLEDIYIPLRAYYEYEKEDDGKKTNIKKAVWLKETMDEWLASTKPEDAIKVIEGGPGSGKSSFAKWWAAQLGKEKQTKVLFFPLHHFNIHSNIKEAVGNYFNDADHIPINFSPLEDTKELDQLLLIFDGLDELVMQGKDAKQAAAAFMDELKQFCGIKNQEKARIKILVTGRPIAVQDTQAKLRGSEEQIMHLLPYYLILPFYITTKQIYEDENEILNEDQRNDWWNKFAVLKGLSTKNLPEDLKSETMDKITTEPLLNYLVALSWMSAPEKFDKEANINTVYEQLISGVYKRDYDPAKRHLSMADLSEEEFMQILEEIAVCAWQGGDARITTERKIEKHIKEKDLNDLLDAYKESTKSGVSKLLTAFYFRKYGKEDTEQRDETFEFTHKSFGEYLLARAIVELVKLTHKKRTLNKERNTDRRSGKKGWTIEEALLEWLKLFGENVLDADISRFVYNEIDLRKTKGEPIEALQKTLCELISEAAHNNMPLHKLDERKTHKEEIRLARNAREALVVSLANCAFISKKVSKINWIDAEKQPAIWLNSLSKSLHNSNFVLKNFNHFSLEGANLEGANLEGANLEGANLEGANLERANLGGANLYRANLGGANLERANLYRANLRGAKLNGAKLNGAIFYRAILLGTNLERAKLRGAKLRGARLERANLLGADLERANLLGANLERAILLGTNLLGANLERAILRGTSLEEADLRGAKLGEAKLSGANLERANLERADLHGANLERANLYESNLYEANLHGVNLHRADLYEAILHGANLEGAVLRRAYLKGAKGLNYNQLSNVLSLYQIEGIPEEIKDRLLIEKPKLFEKPK